MSAVGPPRLLKSLPGTLLFFHPVFAFRPFLFWISGLPGSSALLPGECQVLLHQAAPLLYAVRAPQRIRRDAGFRDPAPHFPGNFRFCSIRLHRSFTQFELRSASDRVLVSGIQHLPFPEISYSAQSGCTAASRSLSSAAHPAGGRFPGPCAFLSQKSHVLLHQAAPLFHAVRAPQRIRQGVGFRDPAPYFPRNFRFCSIRLHRCFTQSGLRSASGGVLKT